ncbi:hypothetical protein FOFC_20925 [Fusarium oxysporum]|nr:Zinc finger protein 143 [Fusarium oxysporum f. sp. conglutinans]KAI8396377.1 hypothetical protein FOFC_20925 [Fusarium oxysporum]
MKPAESVENESTARPFQCDWQSCPKSFTRKSDFVRHYRIHTDERPYVCPIPGCGKRFTRPDIQAKHMLTHTGKKPHQCRHIGFGKRFTDASTLARHRWRLHQQEMSPNDSSDSDDDGSPSTPQLPMNQGDSNGPLHRASSYADFESQVHGYHIPQHRDNRQGIPASVPHEYHGTPVPDQYTPVQPVHRATTMTQEVYYVTEAENPGVATMTNTVPPHYQLSQQGERPPMEIPYSALGTAMSVQSSPSTVSATSVPSPTIPEGFYAHQPGSQPAYTAAESQPAMIEYQQLIQQPMVSQLQYIPATTRYYAPPPAHSQQEQWPYYHPPIEVTTTGQLPAYGPAVYDIYGPKIEFEDPSLQPLSIRLASM